MKQVVRWSRLMGKATASIAATLKCLEEEGYIVVGEGLSPVGEVPSGSLVIGDGKVWFMGKFYRKYKDVYHSMAEVDRSSA